MSDTILVTADGPLRTITLNRPHAMNAMNRRLIDEISQAFDDANRDTGTRAIILTGAGRAFINVGDFTVESLQF